MGHLVNFWAPFGMLGAPKMCHFVFVFLRGKAGEFQRDVLLTFGFSAEVGPLRPHGGFAGVQLGHLVGLCWLFGRLGSFNSHLDFCFPAWGHYGHMQGSQESSWGIL